MSCLNCATADGGTPGGCGNKGHCSSGGCNKLNTYDWLSTYDISDATEFDLVEISFKNGSRKDFFRKTQDLFLNTGDWVVVDTGNGFDIGQISLSGELVRLQMKKKSISENKMFNDIIRKANARDLERLKEARKMDYESMIRARAIARSLDLDMKVGDVEYQADMRKATFFFISDGRVDFRELIKLYAKEFKVKIEMRQIGSRQESSRIGGLGSCGRELCCSTWLTDFKSVSTTAARYQNLAINQSKLSGQCGRLKCCLNYELDTYMDALKGFPVDAEVIWSKEGKYNLLKMDIFKGLMYYFTQLEKGKSTVIAIHIDQVITIKEMNDRGEKPESMKEMQVAIENMEPVIDFADVTGEIELPEDKKRKKKKKKKRPMEDGQSAPAGQRPAQHQGQQQGGPKRNDSNRPNTPRNDQNRQQNQQPRHDQARNNNQNRPQQNAQPKEPRNNQENPQGNPEVKNTPQGEQNNAQRQHQQQKNKFKNKRRFPSKEGESDKKE